VFIAIVSLLIDLATAIFHYGRWSKARGGGSNTGEKALVAARGGGPGPAGQVELLRAGSGGGGEELAQKRFVFWRAAGRAAAQTDLCIASVHDIFYTMMKLHILYLISYVKITSTQLGSVCFDQVMAVL
jgi:hypothetical protein